MTTTGIAKGLGIVVLLFAGVYAPAFLAAKLLRLPLGKAIPVIIAITLAITILLIVALSRRSEGMEEFGFRFCGFRYVVAAILFGVPIGWALTFLVNRVTSTAAPELPLSPWMKVLYLVVGAAIQEEVIFRGLLQTTLARELSGVIWLAGTSFSYAAIIIALLFGLIHMEINPITAAAAFVLGLLSGELRRRSASLVPAILVHAIFNAFSLIS